jgi:hypothetical protein
MSLAAIWGLLGVVASAIVCSAESMIPKPGTEHCVSSVSLIYFARTDQPLYCLIPALKEAFSGIGMSCRLN